MSPVKRDQVQNGGHFENILWCEEVDAMDDGSLSQASEYLQTARCRDGYKVEGTVKQLKSPLRLNHTDSLFRSKRVRD